MRLPDSMKNPPTHQPINPPTVLLISAALMLTGCSASYNGERLFWKAQRIDGPIMKDPNRATPEQFAEAIEAFSRVIQKTRGTEWAARAHAAIGSLHALQRQYGKAREAYATVLQEYSQYRTLCLGARLAIAKTYEIEQQWEEAVRVYQEISDFHPWSKIGLDAPLYIGAVHEKQGHPDQAAHAYERAVLRYLKLVSNAPTLDMVNQAKGYLALAYQRVGKWDETIKTLEELAEAPNGVNRPFVLLALGSLYQAKLGNEKKAEEAFTKLASEFPEHPYGKAAKTRLEHLGLSALPAPSALLRAAKQSEAGGAQAGIRLVPQTPSVTPRSTSAP